MLIHLEPAREHPTADAKGGRELPAGLQVRVIEPENGWTLIARDGEQLGDVPDAALAGMQ